MTPRTPAERVAAWLAATDARTTLVHTVDRYGDGMEGAALYRADIESLLTASPAAPEGETNDRPICETCQQPITGRVVRWLDDVVTCESCTPTDGGMLAQCEGPDVRAGDIIDLADPPLSGYVVGTNWDSPGQWKNPKAARRIERVYRLVWSKDGSR